MIRFRLLAKGTLVTKETTFPVPLSIKFLLGMYVCMIAAVDEKGDRETGKRSSHHELLYLEENCVLG